MMRLLNGSLRVVLTALVLARGADAAEITLWSSNAVKEAFSQLIPEFEKATGHRVTVLWGGTADLRRRVNDGRVADLVIIPATDIDSLIGSGRLAPRSRVDLVTSIIGVAVRAGRPKPDISSGSAVTGALLAAKSIVVSSGPSGVYLLDLFEERGIRPALQSKITQLDPGESVGEALARGRGDIGFTQVSELLHIDGINYVGPLPADIQQTTVFSAALLTNAPESAAARELLVFLRQPRHAGLLKNAGLHPVP
jgi:molybdate transport system substrate-binding protein